MHELVPNDPSRLPEGERRELWRRLLRHVDAIMLQPDYKKLQPSALDHGLAMLAAAIRDHLDPVSLAEAHQALDMVVRVIGCRKPDEPTRDGYVMILRQYPRDLLRWSLVRAMSTETWHKLPTPGALVKTAEAGLERRRELLARVAVAQRRIDMAKWYRDRQRPTSPS